jgi:hypothetical protein
VPNVPAARVESEKFFREGLDRFLLICPVGLLSPRQSNDALEAIISTLHALEISLSHGVKWKALINKYIGTIPVSAEACAAEHNGSAAPPPRTTVSNAMTAKVGAAASDSQPAARRAPVSPLPAGAPAVSCWVAIIMTEPV